MERFIYEAPHGGDAYTQEGGFAACGLEARLGPDRFEQDGPDIVELFMAHLDPNHSGDVVVPPFRVIIEPLTSVSPTLTP